MRATAAVLAVCLALPAGWISIASAAGAPPAARTGAQLEAVAAGTSAAQPFTRTASGVTEFPGLGPSETYGAITDFWTPGEPVVAVGPTDIVQTVNEAAAVYTKTGTKLAELDFGTFWGGTVSNPTQCTDPRALYMAGVDRFAISCSSNSMLFAISATADPTGAWYRYSAPNTSFLDQDKIEATTDKFIIAGNTSTSETIYVYNLSDVVNHVSPKPKPVMKTGTRSNVYQAVVQQTPTRTATSSAHSPETCSISRRSAAPRRRATSS